MSLGDFFKRVIVPVRQRPISEDLNRLQNQLLESVRYLAATTFGTPFAVLTNASANNRYFSNLPLGFMGGSFLVAPNPSAAPFGLLIYPGVGYSSNSPASVTGYDSANGLNYANNNWAPFVLSAIEAGLTVPAPPTAGNSRIDRIEIRADYLANNPQTVGIFNTATEVFDPATRNKDFTWDLVGRTGTVTAPAASTAPISYKTGVAAVGAISAATPAPATSGYTTIALINVVGGAASITQSDIVDMRRPAVANGVLRVAGRAVIPGLAAGLGLEDFSYQDTPPGVFMKMAFQSNTPPSAGSSYVARFYVIGGDIAPLTNNAQGSLVVTPYGSDTRVVAVETTVSSLSTGDIAVLDGSDANWTVVNGTHSFAYGQPMIALDILIKHPTGSALSNDEEFCFQYSLGMA